MKNKKEEHEIKNQGINWEELAFHLSIINHTAKNLRDARNELKEIIWNNKRNVSNSILKDFFSTVDINALNALEDPYGKPSSIREMSRYTTPAGIIYDFQNYFFVDDILEFNDLYDIVDESYDPDNIYDDLVDACDGNIPSNFPHEAKENLLDVAKMINEEVASYEMCIEEAYKQLESRDTIHQYLKTLQVQKENLYELKDAVITKTGIQPLGYHQYELDIHNIYPMYEIGKRKFHRCIDNKYLNEFENIEQLGILAQRSYSVPSNEDVVKSITYCCEYLGVSNLTKSDILSDSKINLKSLTGLSWFNSYKSASGLYDEEYYDDDDPYFYDIDSDLI